MAVVYDEPIIFSFSVILFSCTYADCQFWGDAVSVANHCGLDCLGIESQWGQNFLYRSRLALRPTQPPLQ